MLYYKQMSDPFYIQANGVDGVGGRDYGSGIGFIPSGSLGAGESDRSMAMELRFDPAFRNQPLYGVGAGEGPASYDEWLRAGRVPVPGMAGLGQAEKKTPWGLVLGTAAVGAGILWWMKGKKKR